MVRMKQRKLTKRGTKRREQGLQGPARGFSAQSDHGDPVTRLEQGIRASIGFFRKNPEVLALIRIAGRYEEFQGNVQNGQSIVVADTATHIKEGQASGSIRHGDPELMAHGILGAIFHFVEVYLENDFVTSNDRPELADEAVTFCLQGLLNSSR